MKIVSYPGGTAELREVEELTVRQRRLIENAGIAASEVIQKLPSDMHKMSKEEQEKIVKGLRFTEDEKLLLDRIQDATLLAMVKSLSDRQLPTTVDELQDLPGPVYDALSEATAAMGADIAKTNYAPDPDPKSPTGPSGISG